MVREVWRRFPKVALRSETLGPADYGCATFVGNRGEVFAFAIIFVQREEIDELEQVSRWHLVRTVSGFAVESPSWPVLF